MLVWLSVVLVEISWELVVYDFPPFAVVSFIEVVVLEHEVPDVLDPLTFFVSALSSCVTTVAVRAQFGDAVVVDPDSSATHRKELGDRFRELHFY